MHFEVKIYNIPTKKDCQNRIFTRKNRFLIIIIIIFFQFYDCVGETMSSLKLSVLKGMLDLVSIHLLQFPDVRVERRRMIGMKTTLKIQGKLLFLPIGKVRIQRLMLIEKLCVGVLIFIVSNAFFLHKFNTMALFFIEHWSEENPTKFYHKNIFSLLSPRNCLFYLSS